MNQATFKSAVSLILQRWGFPDDAQEAQEWWTDRLKLAVGDWTGVKVDGFKKAVDALLAAKNQFGRPSPEQIVELARSKAGVSPISDAPEQPVGPYPGGFFCSPQQRKEAAASLRAWHSKNRARIASSPLFGGSTNILADDPEERAALRDER